jgi:DNA-directed RNA polymerase specialized sigma24 family protein
MMPASSDFAVFEALRADLLRLASTLLRGSRVRTGAEDLVQTVLTRVYTGLSSGSLALATIESPRHFAYAALKNHFLDEVKALRTRVETSLERVDGSPVVEPKAAPAQESLLVEQVLALLSVVEREFLVRVVFEECSVEEAQRVCGWPPRSPYYHLKLLLERVREIVE